MTTRWFAPVFLIALAALFTPRAAHADDVSIDVIFLDS